MNGDENNVSARRPCFLHRQAHRRDDVSEPEPASNVLRVPHHHAGSRGTDNSDLHTRALDDCPRPVGVNSLGVQSIGVGREKRERACRPRYEDGTP